MHYVVCDNIEHPFIGFIESILVGCYARNIVKEYKRYYAFVVCKILTLKKCVSVSCKSIFCIIYKYAIMQLYVYGVTYLGID